MRWKRQLAISALLGIVAGTGLASPPFAAAETDSLGAWLPAEVVDLEEPDRLNEPDPRPGAGVRADLRESRWTPRHLWAEAAFHPLGSVRAEWLALPRGPGWGTLRVAPLRGVAVVAGAVVARRPPPLFGEALELTGTLRAPRSPAPGVPGFEAPRGVSSPTLRGVAAVASSGSTAAWTVAGRRDDGMVRAGGVATSRGGLAAALAVGGAAARRVASLSAGWSPPTRGDRFSCEALLTRDGGPEWLAEAVRGSGPLAVEARWRRRPGEARPVAAEFVVRGGSGPVRTRLAWRPWSARAPGDDGRVELETAVRDERLGMLRLRLGARPAEDVATGSGAGRGERYALADLGMARERGRSFALLVSVRESRRSQGRAVASAVGGRLRLSARGRAGAVLLMQARRATATGGDAAPGPWTASFAPSGAEALASRAGSGIAVSGRAWIRWEGFRMEVLVSDAAAPEGETSSAGSLRLEWGRGDP